MPGTRVFVGRTGVAPWMSDVVASAGGVLVEDPGQADVVVWTHPYDVAGLVDVLAAAEQATWVQLPWAGVETYADAGIFNDGRTWTCGKGVYAEPVAEHALALMLAGLRDFTERVGATSWGRPSGRSLYDSRVTILGGGGITESLIALLVPMRVHITVVRRHAQPMAGVAAVVGPEELHAALGGADAVVLALALTPETTGVIARAELAAMADHAWIINVARGRHIVTDDLLQALNEGTIAGAGLDVTDPEPLPDGHPLWTARNCIITPHTANTLEMARPILEARVRENLVRFGRGEPLIGLVDPALGY